MASRAYPWSLIAAAGIGIAVALAVHTFRPSIDTTDTNPDAKGIAVDPSAFATDALVGEVSTEPCTLSGGTETTCYRFQIAGQPANHDIGPFCPRNIRDGAEAGGLWIESGQTWDLSGAFIADLANFYDDSTWQLYDPATGDVYVTDTRESCAGAARPNVAPEYQNHCVECELSYMTTPTTRTVRIPVRPVRQGYAEELDRRGSLGVSLSGVVFDPPAPVHDILAAHTIAAFDDCGGHINLAAGYHYHAATGCSAEVAQRDGHAPLLGYAIDGYGMYGMRDLAGNEDADLDQCRGHEDAERGYHYHVASPGENMFIGCFMGEVGSVGE